MTFSFRHTLSIVSCQKQNPKIIIVPPKTSQFPQESAGKLFLDRLKTHKRDAVAFLEITTDISCTYGDLVTKSVNFAINLRRTLGIVPHDTVAILGNYSHKFWVAALACLYLAAPFHLLNPEYTIYELKRYLMMSEPKVVICSKQAVPNFQSLRDECTFIQSIVVCDDDDDNGNSEVILFKDLVRDNQDVSFEPEKVTDIDDRVAFIVNSSGTTGLPKAVMVTHANLRLNISHAEDPDLYPYHSKSVLLHVMFFHHIHGFNICACALHQGIKMVITDTNCSPETYLGCIEKYKVNKLFVVPIMVDQLATNPLVDQHDVSSIEEIYSAGSTLPQPIHDKVLKKFKIKSVRQIYGATEIGAAVCISPLGSFIPGSCGKVTPGNSLKIVDINTGELLGYNQRGEICVKAATMKGYLKDPESTRAAYDADGFYRTGDVGYYDEDLNVYIIDRLSDIIKYESHQVPPAELEDILLKHPAIKDVAVIGKPDRKGELAVAFVVKKEGVEVGEEEIVEFVKKFVTEEKWLHGGVRFVDNIPRNRSGKIGRKDLRQLLEKELK
ncbi:luciferin 4-monooxygenase-like [Zophobas morio]|uniref:luciferin 4-monooxygenase-like n=1 Tax=Zophobas morio TaxID=2755281 RepID=UPI0030835825